MTPGRGGIQSDHPLRRLKRPVQGLGILTQLRGPLQPIAEKQINVRKQPIRVAQEGLFLGSNRLLVAPHQAIGPTELECVFEWIAGIETYRFLHQFDGFCRPLPKEVEDSRQPMVTVRIIRVEGNGPLGRGHGGLILGLKRIDPA